MEKFRRGLRGLATIIFVAKRLQLFVIARVLKFSVKFLRQQMWIPSP